MKVQKIETLAKLCALFQQEWDKRVGLCHGCWDILHIGHVRHLQAAKKQCDILVATVTSDRFVNKGEGRPVFTADVRAEMLAALTCVDFVAVNDHETAVEVIHLLQPDQYFKGMQAKIQATQNLAHEIKELACWGGCMSFIGEPLASSTELVGKLA